MSSQQYEFGMIGLGTMGRNLVLNMLDHGFAVAGYDKNPAQVAALKKEAGTKKAEAFTDIRSFIDSLQLPRVILLLVPAGPIVDAVIQELKPLLSPGDIIMDCGNSHYTDTNTRVKNLASANLHFVGTGISGGESGARLGPSIMPGGDKDVYKKLSPMLEAVAAKVNGKPCVDYMGNGAAGHYVKMVHNGIEYALMQILAESYHLLKQYGKLSNKEIEQVYQQWNKGKLHSFLVEITAAVFSQPDDKGTGLLIDNIADTAHQKGTGAWMSQDAMQIQAPIPAIDAAVSQRILSSMKQERTAATLPVLANDIQLNGNKADFINQLEDAVHATFIITYAQGLAMLQKASKNYAFDTNIASVASIWRGGCIIRAALLEDITEAFTKNPDLKNLMLAEPFAGILPKEIYSLKGILKTAINAGIPVPSLYACCSYFESYHSGWLPANLIQAQRDFFGAHTYERTDQPGTFHTNWNQTIQ